MSNTRGQPAAGQEYAAQSAAYQQPSGYPVSEQEARYGREPARGAGSAFGTILAGVLMIISGAYGFMTGLAVIIHKGFFVTNPNYAYHWTVTNWGWTQLILGAVVFAAGFGVLIGMAWARVVGVILATLSAVASFLFIPYYPFWAIVLVAVDLFIIWALVAGGRRRRA